MAYKPVDAGATVAPVATPTTTALVPQYTSEQQDSVSQGGAAGAGSIFTGVGFSTTVTSASNGLTATQLTTAGSSATITGTSSVTISSLGTGYTYAAGQVVTVSGFTGSAANANGTWVLTAGALNSVTFTPTNAITGSGGTGSVQYALTLAAVGGPLSPNFFAHGTQYCAVNGSSTFSYTGITSAGYMTGLALVVGSGSTAVATGNPVNFVPLIIPDIGAGASIMRGDGAGLGSPNVPGMGFTDWFTTLSNVENNEAGLTPQSTGFVMPVYSDSVYGGLQWASAGSQLAAANYTASGSGPYTITLSNGFTPGILGTTGNGCFIGQSVTGTNITSATVTSITATSLVLTGTFTGTPSGTLTFQSSGTATNIGSPSVLNALETSQSPQALASSTHLTTTGQVVGDSRPFRRVMIFFQNQTNGASVTFATTAPGTVVSSGAIATNGTGLAVWDSGDLGNGPPAAAGTGFTATAGTVAGSGATSAGVVIVGALYIQNAGTNGVININVAKGGSSTGDWSGASTGLANLLSLLNTMGMTPRRILTGDMAGNDNLILNTAVTTVASNLATFLSALATASPLTQLVVIGIYNIGTTVAPGVGNTVWGNTWIPALRTVAINANAMFIDLWAALGDCSQSGDPFGYTWTDYLHFGNQAFANPLVLPPTAAGPDYPSQSGRTGQETIAEAFFEKLQTSKNFALSGTFQNGVNKDGKIVNQLAQPTLTTGPSTTQWFVNANDGLPGAAIYCGGTLDPAGLYLGPGGSSALDAYIYRSAAGTLLAHSKLQCNTSLGIGTTPPTVGGTTARNPPTSATIQTALGNLALGSALQNTLSYDVRLTVYLSITVNTSGVVKLGVGSTNTPTQTTIITGVTTVGFVPVTFIIPAAYYALLSISGTVTDSIAGQYFEAA